MRPTHGADVVGFAGTAALDFASKSRMPRCLTVDMQKTAIWPLQQVLLHSNDKQFCLHTSSLQTSTSACTVCSVKQTRTYSACCLLLDASWNINNADVSVSLSQLHAVTHQKVAQPSDLPPLLCAYRPSYLHQKHCMHVRGILAYQYCRITSQLMLLHETCTLQYEHNCYTVTPCTLACG
jgi:hypothetical protein